MARTSRDPAKRIVFLRKALANVQARLAAALAFRMEQRAVQVQGTQKSVRTASVRS